MRVLLTEGSSLTSRQVAGRLGALGHQVEILSSTPVCLTRFTRAVHSVHAVPRFGLDPFAWLEAAERIVRERKIDVLFPTHEQVTVLSARQTRLTVPTIVPPFASLKRVQDRIAAFHTLTEVGTPQPETVVVTDAGDVSRVVTFPAFIKKPISTASSGVRRVCDAVELENAVRILGLRPSGLIVQTQAKGPLIMIQAVAQRGQLVAHHACQRLREGIGGGASLKESLVFPGLRGMLARLVTFLDWHGGLSMDATARHRRQSAPRGTGQRSSCWCRSRRRNAQYRWGKYDSRTTARAPGRSHTSNIDRCPRRCCATRNTARNRD